MMKRTGQVVNIDWSIGLGLLILTLVSALVMMSGFQPFDPIKSLENKARDTHTQLIEKSSLEGYRNSLILSSPFSISEVPVDKNYSFPEDAFPGSGYVESGGEIMISEERFIAITDLRNKSVRSVYFTENVSNISYSDDIRTGDWINNSEISSNPESPGLQSLRVNGKEVLKSSASIPGSDYSTDDQEIFGSSLSGNLKIYNNSREIIIENPNSSVFYLKNFTTLYWYPDNSTTDLTGTGSFKTGKTDGFTVASDFGVTFVGNISANVSKPDAGTVKAEVEGERLRVRLHDSDYVAGWKRIKSHDKGYVVLSAREKISGANKNKLEKIDNLSEEEFAKQLNLEDRGYNITVSKNASKKSKKYLEKGDDLPIRNIVTLNLGINSLNRKGEFENIRSRVAIWR